MSTFADSWRLAWTLIAGGDAELWRIAMLSLQVSGIAVAVGSVAGLLLGAWLAVARFPGHGVFVWAVNTLLALPAVVVGQQVDQQPHDDGHGGGAERARHAVDCRAVAPAGPGGTR